MPKRGSARRNIALILVFVLALFALIVVTPMLRKPVVLVPPEAAEVTAKRLGTDGAPDDNAFRVLVEAGKLLPEQPVPSQRGDEGRRDRGPGHPDDWGHRGFRGEPGFQQAPIQGRLAAWITQREAKLDLEVSSYLDGCEAALAKTREAFGKPYYLLPIDWADPKTWGPADMYWAMEDGVRIQQLRLALEGRCLRIVRGKEHLDEKEATEAFGYLIDAARLGDLLTADGKTADYAMQTHPRGVMVDIAHDMPEPALRAALEGLRTLDGVGTTVGTTNLEFYFRMIQSTPRDFIARRMQSDPWDPHPPERARFFMEMAFGVHKTRVMRWVAANREAITSAVALSYPDYMAWKEKNQDLVREDHHHRLTWRQDTPLNIVDQLLWGRAYAQTYQAAAKTALALELYRLSHNNEYPEALDALAPQYIESVPRDAFGAGPLAYRRTEGDYLLYGVGTNGKDEGGQQGQVGQGDVVFHGPRAGGQ